ncbi:phosphate starvation-inducible protein PhoH [Klebsiella pneumoniae]|nr:phosphate starvation-inducible protein PhoH [Klebsiella pneumoniae]
MRLVILDEAQNVTAAQMKMFLTRLGENVTVIVNGDITQCDLPSGVEIWPERCAGAFLRKTR